MVATAVPTQSGESYERLRVNAGATSGVRSMPLVHRKRENEKARLCTKSARHRNGIVLTAAAMAVLTVKRGQQACCSCRTQWSPHRGTVAFPILPAVDDEDEDHDNWLGSD